MFCGASCLGSESRTTVQKHESRDFAQIIHSIKSGLLNAMRSASVFIHLSISSFH
jgi:hypothetical protein